MILVTHEDDETGAMETKPDVLYIVIPAYNEEENIRMVVSDWYPVICGTGGDSQLVVIDDGSSDGTYGILCQMAKTRPQLVALTKENGGHGAAVLLGYRYAVEHGADYVFQTDSDGQTSPDEFLGFWKSRADYDAVFGYRRVRGDGALRALVEKIVCLLLRIYFGVKVPDANAPFRLMRADALAKYMDRLPRDYNLPNIMLTTFFVHDGRKVTFREISFHPRQGGKNSVNLKRIVRIGWKAIGDFRKLKRNM